MSGLEEVEIKASPTVRFEGAEAASLWEEGRDGGGAGQPPTYVLEQLESPDKVIPRPAEVRMSLNEFLDRLEGKKGRDQWRNASLYLEYFALQGLPTLKEHYTGFPFANLLHSKHINVWIGDGRSVGKLHFDPYDNLLAQVSGRKIFTLFDPLRNDELYEGHMREAQIDFDKATGEFKLRKLLDSTRMVMSPIDLGKPIDEIVREYPSFGRALRRRMTCEVRAGEILYLPAFWWHEVQSVPDSIRVPQNVAVNEWFAPFWDKDFPCRTCPLRINPAYHEAMTHLGL